MKWFIVNQQDPPARLYWSEERGSWGGKAQASTYARVYRNKTMPLCFLGASWMQEGAS
jgi:hypothetical protein